MSIGLFIGIMATFFVLSVVGLRSAAERDSGVSMGAGLLAIIVNVGGLIYGLNYYYSRGDEGSEGSASGSVLSHFIPPLWVLLMLPLAVMVVWAALRVRRELRKS
ncbi:hypothetical protein [Gordonia sihwensis]|uniref:hypothetical protein n=1 Tax=Gordonia sihwensis TaxID=173559 RepID=UPI003D96084B